LTKFRKHKRGPPSQPQFLLLIIIPYRMRKSGKSSIGMRGK
jgi:hypothetical protein